jgi:two-component system, response regulator, stage 0 sporulation protein A
LVPIKSYFIFEGGLQMSNIKLSTVIVDDNKEFCTVISDCLEAQKDFAIDGICHNGIEAVKFVKENTPNLIILDIVMPRLDGLGVLEKFIALNLNPKPIIIVLSAIGLDDITQRAISLGADYYFIKPFDMDEFIIRVRQLAQKNELTYKTETAGSSENIKEVKPKGEKNINLETQITDIMHEVGIPANIKGYVYLRDAINMVLNDASLLNSITRKLYPGLASKYKTIPSKIERSIRHAIEVGCSRGRSETLNELFKRSFDTNKHIPSSSEFITAIAEAIVVKNSTK